MAECPDRDRYPCRGVDGRPVYIFDPRPGSVFLVVIVGPDTYDAIWERGYATLDDVRANLMRTECDRELGWMRFALEQPYQRPEVRAEFEGVEEAETAQPKSNGLSSAMTSK